MAYIILASCHKKNKLGNIRFVTVTMYFSKKTGFNSIKNDRDDKLTYF